MLCCGTCVPAHCPIVSARDQEGGHATDVTAALYLRAAGCVCARPRLTAKSTTEKGKEPLGCKRKKHTGEKVLLVEGADVAGAPMPQHGFKCVSLNASLVSFPQKKTRRITNGMNENIAFIALPLICHALILKPLDLDHFIHP